MDSSPGLIKPKTILLAFVAFPLSTHRYGERSNTGWFEIRIMCPSGSTCLPADYCFSELTLYKKLTKRVDIVKNGQYYHLIECHVFSPRDLGELLFIWC